MLRWAKVSLNGPVAPPIDHLVTVPGLALVTAPSLLFINYSNNYSRRWFYVHLVCLHLYIKECDWLGLHCWYFYLHDRVATMQIKIAFLSSIFSACLNIIMTLCRYFLFLTLRVIIVLLCIRYCCGGQELKNDRINKRKLCGLLVPPVSSDTLY